MKKQVDVVVVIPVGPGTVPDFVKDTIDSYSYYTRSSVAFIITDDSHQGIGEIIKAIRTEVDVITTPRPMGGWAGLYINEATAFRHALLNYDFKALMKLDTDALIIDVAPEKEVLELFATQPNIGLAGQYPNYYDGTPWDLGWPRDRILNGTTTWKYFRRPFTNWFLRKLYLKAKRNSYKAGESVFGGAYFFSHSCLARLMEEGLLPMQQLIGLNMGEDHIFALLVKAVGFDFGGLSAPGQPFGLAWKGLPVSPEQLIKDEKKIIHSTRSWKGMDENQIRTYFRQYRVKTPVAA